MKEDDHDPVARRRELFAENAEPRRDKIFRIVYSRTQDRELAEEIAQDAFVRILSIMDRTNWQQIENEDAYLTRIACNLLMDHWRTKVRTEWVSLAEPTDRLLQLVNEFAGTFDIEKQIYLEELLKKMPWKTILVDFSAAERRLLRLHMVEGLTYEEIAQEVGENVIIVKYHLQRIYATIRARVRKIFGKTGFLKSDS